MKCTVPEIAWHNRDPVLSVDFQCAQGKFHRLVTGGTDCHVVIWYVKIDDNGEVNLELASDLRRHNKAVNVVRFSPSGEFLASGDDEAAIWIWKKSDKDVNPSADLFNDEDDKETNQEQWTGVRMLRGHIEDVYDLCWSPDSYSLISGSVDNSAILWDVHKGKKTTILSDHKGFVQGVAWDPLNKYVATLCSDRSCRIYNIGSQRAAFRIQKTTVAIQAPVSVPSGQTCKSEGDVQTRSLRLFHDDTLKSFCRRLTFSPDGQMLITPSGIFEKENGTVSNVTYIFSRANLSKPALLLPVNDKCTVAVRCCPVLFELRTNKEDKPSDSPDEEIWNTCLSVFKLPYRMVFAVATQDCVFFYDTQQHLPFGQVSNIHYTRLSDLTWSSDGRIVVVSSTDGFCSIISFKEGELGDPYDAAKRDQVIANVPPIKPVSAPTSSSLLVPVPSATEGSKLSGDLAENSASTQGKAETGKSGRSIPVVKSPTQKLLAATSTKSVTASPNRVMPAPAPAPPKQHKRVAFVTLSTPKSSTSSENSFNKPAPEAAAKEPDEISNVVECVDITIDSPMVGTKKSGKLDDSVWLSDSPLTAQKKDDLAPGDASDDVIIIDEDDAVNSATTSSVDSQPTSDSLSQKTIVALDSQSPDAPRSPTAAKPLAEAMDTSVVDTGKSSDAGAVSSDQSAATHLTRELANVTVGSQKLAVCTATTSATTKPQVDHPEPSAVIETSSGDNKNEIEQPDIAIKVCETIAEGGAGNPTELGSTSGGDGVKVASEIVMSKDEPEVTAEAKTAIAGVPGTSGDVSASGQARPPRRVALITLGAGRKP